VRRAHAVRAGSATITDRATALAQKRAEVAAIDLDELGRIEPGSRHDRLRRAAGVWTSFTEAVADRPTQASRQPRGRRLLSAQLGSVALATEVLVATRKLVFDSAQDLGW
jgi:hypothetical protein